MALVIVRDAYDCLGWRLLFLGAIVLVSAVLEALGLTMLFPVMAKLGLAGGEEGVFQQVTRNVLATVGIPDELWALLILTVVALCLQIFAQTLKGWCEANYQTRYCEFLQQRLFSTFIDAQWTFFAQQRGSTHVNAIMNETTRIASALLMIELMATSLVFVVVYGILALLSA